MAQEWPDTTFVGFDVASVQTDLWALAKAEGMLREDFDDLPENGTRINWQDLAERVTWHIGDL